MPGSHFSKRFIGFARFAENNGAAWGFGRAPIAGARWRRVPATFLAPAAAAPTTAGATVTPGRRPTIPASDSTGHDRGVTSGRRAPRRRAGGGGGGCPAAGPGRHAPRAATRMVGGRWRAEVLTAVSRGRPLCRPALGKQRGRGGKVEKYNGDRRPRRPDWQVHPAGDRHARHRAADRPFVPLALVQHVAGGRVRRPCQQETLIKNKNKTTAAQTGTPPPAARRPNGHPAALGPDRPPGLCRPDDRRTSRPDATAPTPRGALKQERKVLKIGLFVQTFERRDRLGCNIETFLGRIRINPTFKEKRHARCGSRDGPLPISLFVR